MKSLATLKSEAFSDFDAYAAAIEDADLRMRLPHLERSHWEMQQLALHDSTNVQLAKEGSGSLPTGAVREDGFVVFLVEGDYRANGERLDRDSVFLMPPGKDFCIPSKGENEWISVFIPLDAVEATELMPLFNVDVSSACFVHPSRGAADRLRSTIKRFVAGAQVEPGLLQEVESVKSFRKALADCVKDCLLVDTAKSARRIGRPAKVDGKLIASAVELIEDSPEPILSLEQLVKALDLSERSIQTGFQKYLGVSPRRYTELCRLHRARKQLATGSLPETTVTNVAAQLGMWDFGRFAARYRAVFGERPSETLKRQ